MPIGHQSAANPVQMACQSGDNPVPIHSQSCSNLVFTLQSGSNPSIIYCRQDVDQLPILCQSGSSPVPIRHHSEANGLPGLNDSVQISINLWPIHQANPWPIGCQSLANTKLLPIPTALAPIRCQSHSNPLSMQPILCQSDDKLVPIYHQSIANLTSIKCPYI